MITLHPYQQETVDFFRQCLERGGTMKFNVPTGYGRSVILAEALKGRDYLFVSSIFEMRNQFRHIAEQVGLESVRTISAVDALQLKEFKGVVVICESVRDPSKLIARFERIGCTVVCLGQ